MAEIRKTAYQGYEVVEVSNGDLSLVATVSAGPRILKFSAFSDENLFAELPDTVLTYPGEGDLHLIGGHRLWYAPENPATTYIPDGNRVEWRQIVGGVELIQQIDAPTQVQKMIRVEMDEEAPRVTITHTLINHGSEPFTLAPWAITQLRPGGKAIIPQKTDNADENGLLPNRNIAIWPYTDLDSSNIQLKNDSITVFARMTEGALKIGAPNPEGWIGYDLDGLLFVKRAQFQDGGKYLDRGASSQIFCNQYFIELETLGPAVSLGPDDRVRHEEAWEVFPAGSWPENIQSYFD